VQRSLGNRSWPKQRPPMGNGYQMVDYKRFFDVNLLAHRNSE
jgi:hypothetical protein